MSELMPIIGICGPSGSGKSSSLENLPALFPDPKAVVFLDLERKGFPFRLKNPPVSVDKYGLMDIEFDKALAGGAKVIVIESWTMFSYYCHAFAKEARFTGYDLYREYNMYMRKFLKSKVKNTKAIVIFTGINELVTIEASTGESDAATEKLQDCFAVVTGKEMQGKVEQDMLIVLHTIVNVDRKTKTNEHLFLTQTDGVKTAKAPKWLNLPRTIPNDLAPVVKCLIEGKPWVVEAKG